MSGIVKDALAENVIAALCFNEECAVQLLLAITPEMFENKGFQLIAQRAMDYIRKYNQPPAGTSATCSRKSYAIEIPKVLAIRTCLKG